MTAVDRLRLPLLTDEVVLVDVPAAPLALLQPQVERMLETRLREALLPALAHLEETLQREARCEIGGALREMVAGAVAQEIGAARRR